MELREFSQNRILLLDGAMGTMLQASGVPLGKNPEALNITAPQAVGAVHTAYLAAGAQLILTNTFGANAQKLEPPYTVSDCITAAVQIAREAVLQADHTAFVALDIGPIGALLAPHGTLDYDIAYGLFREQVVAGVAAGVDAIVIETMTDLLESKCAILAAKSVTNLPIFATMSFERNHRTFMGTSLASMALTFDALGVDFIGLNCSVGPAEMVPMVAELVKWTNRPLVIKPNAGLPEMHEGQTKFNITTEDFSAELSRMVAMGACAVGGCCGTNPTFISALCDATHTMKPVLRNVSVSAVCSASKAVTLEGVRVIGERINPTGKKLFQKALREGDMDYVLAQAIEQVEAGADILDVNVGLPDIDEPTLMARAVDCMQSIIHAPLQLDSSNPEALESGLRRYAGKPIVNSVNGDDEVLARVLPLVKKYGAAVVGLTLDKNGIPPTAEKRLAIAAKIVDAAVKHGIPKTDVFIDCLTLTAAAEQSIAYETIRALTLIKEQLQVKTVLGVSNISFGLPARQKLNRTFLTLALAAGLDMPIINPNETDMMDAVYCVNQLMNRDTNSAAYIARFATATTSAPQSRDDSILYCIEHGLKEEIKSAVETALTVQSALEVVNQQLIPALDVVGKQYEAAQIFLPQLLQAAEAAKAGFAIVQSRIPPSEQTERHTIVLATVEGDVHDIGKNIVKVVLENYGYNIVDLGRNVPVAQVVQAAVERKATLVGLSALMTTTVDNMEKTIKALREADSTIQIMVGGAVLTHSYAMQIGADYYAKDAMEAVAVAKKVFE